MHIIIIGMPFFIGFIIGICMAAFILVIQSFESGLGRAVLQRAVTG